MTTPTRQLDPDPDMDRADAAIMEMVGERETLERFVDYFRVVLARKARGLDQAGLAATVGTSDLTIGGLVKHLAHVEDTWFTVRLAGEPVPEVWRDVGWDADPDWDLRSAAADDPAELLALFEAACERSRHALAQLHDLDAMTVVPNRRGDLFSLRWVLVHMIEEYARHVGHADLIRQSVDGVVGD